VERNISRGLKSQLHAGEGRQRALADREHHQGDEADGERVPGCAPHAGALIE